MAEWRARGYVADSDEEEDSQTTIPNVIVTSIEAPPSTDDPGSGGAEEQHDAGVRGEGAAVEDLRLEHAVEESGAVSEERAVSDRSSPQGQGVQEIDRVSAVANAVGDRDIPMEEYEDIDELQQDYYKATPSAQLKGELERRTRIVSTGQNRSPPSARRGFDAIPVPSLPLSVVYSQTSVASLKADIMHSTPGDAQPGAPRDLLESADPPQGLPDPSLLEERPPLTRPTRSLRHRNAIQLHPYLVESEKYRQSLKARGLRPLRMDPEAARALERESQNVAYNAEESQLNDDEGDLYSSSPVRTQDSSPKAAGKQSDVFVLGDDDLPDVNALLQNPTRRYLGNGYKRRKTASTTFRMPPRLPPDQGNPMVVVPMLQDDYGMSDIPPSPPHSGSLTPLKVNLPKKPKFRMPRGSSPPALPTPVTSSEPRRRLFPDVFVDERSDTQSHNRVRSASPSERSDAGAPTSEDEPSHQLHRVQRKIRGVLPASWLKLDLKSQKKKPDSGRDVRRSTSLEIASTQRGVARPVASALIKISNPLGSRDGQIHLSDDDEESGSEKGDSPQEPSVERSWTSVQDDTNLFMSGRWGEAAEDDQVDAMLPTATRARVPRPKEKKRQRNLAEFRPPSRSVAPSITKRARSQRQVQPNITDQFDKGHRRKPAFHLPKLSLLDAPSLRKSSPIAVPRFLKIASRTTRSRNDKGRQSPTRKYIRLATRDDDNDMNETLRDWREGTIAPLRTEKAVAANCREPLRPRSDNNSLPSRENLLPGRIREIKTTAAKSNRTRPRFRSAKSWSLQTSLDNLIQRQDRDRVDMAGTLGFERPLIADNKPKKRGQIVSSLRAGSNARPAMLQSARGGGNEVHAQAIFQRDLARINHFDDSSGLPNVLRLFEDEQRPVSKTTHLPTVHASDQQRITKPTTAKRNPVSRKRQPQRMDVSTPWSKSSGKPIDLDDFTDEAPSVQLPPNIRSKDVLLGLGPLGTRYSVSFDVTPLPTGTCFHESTVLGSGLFARSLKLSRSRRLNSSRGYQIWTNGGKSFRWGPWNDAVSSELGEVIILIIQAIRDVSMPHQEVSRSTAYEKTLSLLKTIIGYFSDHLSFLDPIDRLSCIQRLRGLVPTLLVEVLDQLPGNDISENQAMEEPQLAFRIPVCTLILMFVNQLRQLADHEAVPRQIQEEVKSLVHTTAQQTLSLALTERLQEFETCLSCLQNPDAASYILNQKHPIEAFIVAQHVSGQQPACRIDVFQDLQKELLTKSSDGVYDIQNVEKSWKKLFTLLPFLEFDAEGTLETGQRFKVAFDNWTLVKRMISPVFDASLNNPRGQAPSFNAYCRALISRCLYLIEGWGWRKCDSIIGTLFDFFGGNNLGHLRNEVSHGSPLFLEQLNKKPSLNAEPEDRCFHIFLKTIGSGLKHMRQIYSEKKIRDIVWRLMPNHGRFHPKEEPVRQEDLDALRNHHDLLSTLYWASPASCRPRLTVIRNLVHLETSHREACHINIRAWLNLVTFQLSTDEPVNTLEPFAEWHNDLLQQILRQHALARTEAEEQVRSVQYAGGLAISKDLLESTIANNQRQVEAMLSDALVSLKLAIDAAPNEEAATVLMPPILPKVFELFDARRTQAIKTVIQTLDVLSAYANKILAAQHSRDDNDDSQDYGDWSAFDDDNALIKPSDEVASPLQTIHEPLRHLLSNCFGADLVPEDSLLLKLVDVWTTCAQVLVRKHARFWSDYVDLFGNDSWSSLRDTEQTRKYTALYIATLIEKDSKIYQDHQTFFSTSWVGSLVERESLLKFQHRLTETLLNANIDSPFLKNLPFFTDPTDGCFRLTAAEFSERRLSLISSVLSNMRVSLEQAVFDPAVDAAQLRQQYKDLLKHLMCTMKHNYQELSHGSNVRGAYVDFVHHVVEFLQQHTATICPIDRFFTDNGAFPLPATDPTYVVGQLKNYALRLQDPRTPKQLAIFLQSVSERAAVDGQQPYLVGQLHTAMSNTFEDGVAARPTLRSFIIKAIIPAYTGLAFITESRWILTLPYLQALQKVFSELFMDLDGCNTKSINAVASIITAFLDSVRGALGVLLYPSSLLEKPRILKTLSACYAAITALLPVLDYLIRLSGSTKRAVEDIDFLQSFNVYVSSTLRNDSDASPPEIDNNEDATYAETRSFAFQELRDTLTKHWACHDGQFYIVRGASRREVVMDIGLFEEERQELFKTFEQFFECLRAMPALGDGDDDDRALTLGRSRAIGLDGLVF